MIIPCAKGQPSAGQVPAKDCTPDESTTEGPSPLELAEGLIEALSIPMNASLLCQVSNCIEIKARADGISFAEAHDKIHKAAREHPPLDGRWTLWFLKGGYGHCQLS